MYLEIPNISAEELELKSQVSKGINYKILYV